MVVGRARAITGVGEEERGKNASRPDSLAARRRRRTQGQVGMRNNASWLLTSLVYTHRCYENVWNLFIAVPSF